MQGRTCCVKLSDKRCYWGLGSPHLHDVTRTQQGFLCSYAWIINVPPQKLHSGQWPQDVKCTICRCPALQNSKRDMFLFCGHNSQRLAQDLVKRHSNLWKDGQPSISLFEISISHHEPVSDFSRTGLFIGHRKMFESTGVVGWLSFLDQTGSHGFNLTDASCIWFEQCGADCSTVERVSWICLPRTNCWAATLIVCCY